MNHFFSKKIIAAGLSVFALSALGDDARIRTIDYVADQVFVIPTALGVSTLILLENGEQIVDKSVGFSSDCADVEKGAEWCIRAPKGDNKIFVKSLPGATFNDMQLVTNKRIYSLVFENKGTPKSARGAPSYRVTFRYGPEGIGTIDGSAIKSFKPLDPRIVEGLADAKAHQILNAERTDEQLVRRNTNYTMDVGRDSRDIVPDEAFDDGRFTYFKFGANHLVPSVFIINADGTESLARTYMVKGTDYLAVQALAKRFVFRLDKQAVGVWNENYDRDGVTSRSGTTIPGMTRQVKQ